MSEPCKVYELDEWRAVIRQIRQARQTALEQAAEEQERLKRVAQGNELPSDVEAE